MADESIRDTLMSVMAESNASSTPSPSPAPSPVSPSPSPAPAVVGTPAPAPVDVPGVPSAAPAPVSGTPPATPGAPPASGTEDPAASQVQQNLGTVINQKAPGTWSPQAREHWETVPAEVRAEIWKREKETSRAMTISASARAFEGQFKKTMEPFMGFIAAEGAEPLQAVNYLMQNAAILRVGSPQQKAQLVYNIINQWGVDVEMLDSMFDPNAAPQRNNPNTDIQRQIQQAVQQAVQPIQQTYQQQQQQMLAEITSEVDTTLADFASKHEFYDDVKDDMADIIEMASKRGVNMPLTEAYERATLLSAPVRAVMERRKTASAAQTNHQAAQQAKSGAFGVKDSAAAGVTNAPAGDSIRDAIQWSIAHHSGRN